VVRLIARRDFSDLGLSAEISQNPQGRQDLGIGWQRILTALDGLPR
jgi:hypothetical protein